MTAIERMAAVDRAWLLMERPTNPMMVVGLVVLEQPLALAALRQVVAQRFLAYERFRCRPESDALGALWQPCEDFELADHVVAAALPAPAGRRQLEELAGRLASTPLDSCRPRWSFHLVERYRRGSALIVRIHHCYADGIALVRVLLALTDAHAQPSTVAAGSPLPKPAPGLLGEALHLALHPGEALRSVRVAGELAFELAHTAALPDDPHTPLKRPLGSVKRVAWGTPLPLEEARALAHVLGCTVNDIALATLAGALGRWLRSQGEPVHGLRLRAAVPVNLRSEAAGEPVLGNRFGLAFVELPVGIDDPIERAAALRDVTRALKGSSQPLVIFGLLAAVGGLPAALEEPALEIFSSKASLVVSNVPGPPETLRLAGVPVTDLLFWVPQAGSLGVGVSILSYHGQLQFGVIADRRLLREPRSLVALFTEEFERLVMLVLLGADELWAARSRA